MTIIVDEAVDQIYLRYDFGKNSRNSSDTGCEIKKYTRTE
jgi:hypothetical protein